MSTPPPPPLISNDYLPNTMGINIPQVLVAGVENMLVSKGSVKHTALLAASVGISNLVPAYAVGATGSLNWCSGTEKYLIEPALAGILYAIGSKYVIKDKEGGMFKNFGKGFLIGSSSAGVTASILSVTVAKEKVPSQYSSRKEGLGLRNEANTKVFGSSAAFIIS